MKNKYFNFVKFFKNKIKSKNGASIAMGLLIFVICAILSAIIISAATVSAGRVAQVKEKEGTYLIVMGTTQMFQKDFENLQFLVENKQIGSDVLVDVKAVRPDGTLVDNGTTTENTGIVRVLLNAIKEVRTYRKDITHPFTMEGKDSKKNEYVVYGTIKVDKDYNVSIYLEGASSSGNSRLSRVAYNIVLKSDATRTDDEHQTGVMKLSYSELQNRKPQSEMIERSLDPSAYEEEETLP